MATNVFQKMLHFPLTDIWVCFLRQHKCFLITGSQLNDMCVYILPTSFGKLKMATKMHLKHIKWLHFHNFFYTDYKIKNGCQKSKVPPLRAQCHFRIDSVFYIEQHFTFQKYLIIFMTFCHSIYQTLKNTNVIFKSHT